MYRPEHYRKLSQEEKEFLYTTANQLALYLEREILKERTIESDELKKSEGLYRTILDSVSHEIKTPVTSIIGIASALQDANIICDRNKLAELARDLSDSAERLDRIVTNLLDMSRLASGMLAIKKDWQEVGELISASVQRLGNKLAGHQVSTEIADGLPLVKIDFTLMEQALQNVIWNAINYTPEGTEIVIRALRDQNLVAIIVEDNGPGVEEAELPYIFDKFYRTKEAPPGGTGLGLAISKAIVEAHDGEITARNRKAGGLEVRFVLPIENQPVLKELPNE